MALMLQNFPNKISKMKCCLLLPVLLTQVTCDQLVPSSPEIFYGGFLPMLNAELTENSDMLPEKRKSRQLPVFEDNTSENKRSSRVFQFKEGDARNHFKKTFFSKKIFPVHKEKNPKFPIGTWYDSTIYCFYTIKFLFQKYQRRTNSQSRMLWLVSCR